MSSTSRESSEISSKESSPLVTAMKENTPQKQKHFVPVFYYFQLSFWIFTICVLTICLFASMRYNQSQCEAQYSYENGYDTEFRPAREAIKIKKVKFTGGLYYDNGTLLTSSNPEEPIYIGPPSEEIDKAWEALIHDRYLAITPSEAKEVSSNIWFDQENRLYHAGVDVLHTLHCLNYIRMFQDFEYYSDRGQIEKGSAGRKHIDHCINHLRQIVQCHGDLTPLPVIWADIKQHPKGGRAIPDFDQVHTCRDFSTIRKWSTEHDQKVQQMVKQQLQATHHRTI